MSLGIADPVTRDTHGSGQSYYKQLAKEVYQILERPLEVIMNLTQQVKPPASHLLNTKSKDE